MIEAIREHRVFTPHQRRDRADIRHVTRREQERARQAHELRQRSFQIVMRRRVSGDQVRRTRADAEKSRAFACRDNQSRVGGESQIIVAAERDDLAPIDYDVRALRTGKHWDYRYTGSAVKKHASANLS